MKNFIILFIAAIFFTNCQSTKNDVLDEQLNMEEQISIEKTESFKRGGDIEKGILFVILETDNPAYTPTYFMEAMLLMDPDAKKETAHRLDIYIDKEITKGREELPLIERVDQELISYFNLQYSILEMEENNAELAAKTLTRILKYSKSPMEWRLLSETLLVARPALTNSEFQKYKSSLQANMFEFIHKTPTLYSGEEAALKNKFKISKERLLKEAKYYSRQLSRI